MNPSQMPRPFAPEHSEQSDVEVLRNMLFRFENNILYPCRKDGAALTRAIEALEREKKLLELIDWLLLEAHYDEQEGRGGAVGMKDAALKVKSLFEKEPTNDN